MAADIVVIRACPLQQELGASGFLAKHKLRILRDVVEANVPEDARATTKVQPIDKTYAQIVAELGDFEKGIPLCADCPASGRKAVGCYEAVNYPIDAFFEEQLFEFVVNGYGVSGSPAAAIVADVVPNIPASGLDWHTRRGGAEDGALAARKEPLVHHAGGFFSKKRVFDSAQLLQVLFSTVEDPAWIAGMTLFVLKLAEHCARQPGAAASRTFEQFKETLRLYAAATNLASREPTHILIDG
jgi:hypothetical protein